jgi:hypothetical protein
MQDACTSAEGPQDVASVEAVQYDDSSVLKYTAGEAAELDAAQVSPPAPCTVLASGRGERPDTEAGLWRALQSFRSYADEGRPLQSFSTTPATYADAPLHRVYSAHSHGCLVVAGGHQVRIQVNSRTQLAA